MQPHRKLDRVHKERGDLRDWPSDAVVVVLLELGLSWPGKAVLKQQAVSQGAQQDMESQGQILEKGHQEKDRKGNRHCLVNNQQIPEQSQQEGH